MIAPPSRRQEQASDGAPRIERFTTNSRTPSSEAAERIGRGLSTLCIQVRNETTRLMIEITSDRSILHSTFVENFSMAFGFDLGAGSCPAPGARRAASL
jgi:hypothetical protein